MSKIKNKNFHYSSLLLLISTPLTMANLAVAEPSLTNLGMPTDTYLARDGMSDDGSTFVGYNRKTPPQYGARYIFNAMKWTETSGITRLECQPNFPESKAFDNSADGTITVGYCFSDPYDPLTHTATVWHPYNNLPILLWGGNATNVSTDGRTVIGNSPDPLTGYTSVMRWNADTNTQETLLTHATVNNASDDGNVIIGILEDESGTLFRWENGITTTLPLPDESLYAPPHDYYWYTLSGDGSVIYASRSGNAGNLSSRWTQATGWVTITDTSLDGLFTQTNFDGSIAIGSGYSKDPDGPVFGDGIIWDTTNGYRFTRDVIQEWGLSTEGSRIGRNVTYISGDGTTLAGIDTRNLWRARLSGTPILPSDKPVSVNDYMSLYEDVPSAFVIQTVTGNIYSVLKNDYDPNNEPLTAVQISQPVNGVLSFATDGTFTYEPNQDYFGKDSFTYTANNGLLSSEPTTVYITVDPFNDIPVASIFVASFYPTSRSDISFYGTASHDVDGSIVSYQWDFGDGKTASGYQATHSYKKTGTYNVTLTVTDNEGASSSTTEAIQVFEGGGTSADTVPSVAITGGPYTGLKGKPLTLDASASYDPDGGSIIYYSWEFGDGSAAEGSNISHTYESAGTYSITLTVIDDDGETSTSTTTAEITAEISADAIPPVADPGGPYTGLARTNIQFDGSNSSNLDGYYIPTYSWDFGDGNIGTGALPTHTYKKPGTYTVTLTVTDDSGLTHSASTTAVMTR